MRDYAHIPEEAVMTRCSGRGLFTSAATAVLFTSAALAGDGVVALQTADPSCPDDSGKTYIDCGNGTVTDNRTGLVWLKDANCFAGGAPWWDALDAVANLADLPSTSSAAAFDCGLSDGSSPGEWRLPTAAEWEEMTADGVALGCPGFGLPAITSDAGNTCWAEGPGNSFMNVGVDASTGFFYMSATSNYIDQPLASGDPKLWVVILNALDTDGDVLYRNGVKVDPNGIWPVRGGQ
jgi:hypothetical protein